MLCRCGLQQYPKIVSGVAALLAGNMLADRPVTRYTSFYPATGAIFRNNVVDYPVEISRLQTRLPAVLRPPTAAAVAVHQMKSSPEPIWKQHRRIKEEKGKGNGSTSASSAATESPSVKAAPAAAAGAGAGSSSSREADIQTGRKLTQRLGKASTEGSFNMEEVLEILQKVSQRE